MHAFEGSFCPCDKEQVGMVSGGSGELGGWGEWQHVRRKGDRKIGGYRSGDGCGGIGCYLLSGILLPVLSLQS